jgi:hypothetical protein
MGQIVHALIQHKFSPEEILKLPEYLRNISDDTLTGQWHWTTANINKEILINSWTRKGQYFINNPHSERDLALLKKDNLTLHFSSPHLITFDNLLRWDTYKRNDQLRKQFNRLTKPFQSHLMLLTYSLFQTYLVLSFIMKTKT